jgi:signal transduction histidine kinase
VSTGGFRPAPAPHNARQAVARLLGCSVRQGLLGLALLLAGGALAYAAQAYAWLGLFGILLLAPAVASAALLGAHALAPFSRGWGWTWAVLCGALALAGALAQPLYGGWMAGVERAGLNPLQVLACTLGFGALALALPLRYAQSQAGALRLAALEQAALSAQLKALQAQVEPHFLYNTLANTRYLARHDPDKAVQMLDHLIAYLRSALPDMRNASSSLGREFELAEHYLALMAIRFGARLSVRLDCPAALRDADLPPLMLMSLVENAVQHGVEPQPGPVCVSVAASAVGGQLRVLVRDDGAGMPANVLGSGVGLRNLRQRLAALFGAAAAFELRIGAGGATEAELRLPLRFAAPAAAGGADE